MKREVALELFNKGEYKGELIFLSKNFTLQELTKTEHREFVKENFYNALSDVSLFNKLMVLSNKLLQPLRDLIKCPINITSGYRCPNLNKAIGSSDKSQHILGEAVDFVLIKAIPIVDQFITVYNTLKENKIDYGQLIYEHTWIHLSLPNKAKGLFNQEPLEYTNGKYKKFRLLA